VVLGPSARARGRRRRAARPRDRAPGDRRCGAGPPAQGEPPGEGPGEPAGHVARGPVLHRREAHDGARAPGRLLRHTQGPLRHRRALARVVRARREVVLDREAGGDAGVDHARRGHPARDGPDDRARVRGVQLPRHAPPQHRRHRVRHGPPAEGAQGPEGPHRALPPAVALRGGRGPDRVRRRQRGRGAGRAVRRSGEGQGHPARRRAQPRSGPGRYRAGTFGSAASVRGFGGRAVRGGDADRGPGELGPADDDVREPEGRGAAHRARALARQVRADRRGREGPARRARQRRRGRHPQRRLRRARAAAPVRADREVDPPQEVRPGRGPARARRDPGACPAVGPRRDPAGGGRDRPRGRGPRQRRAVPVGLDHRRPGARGPRRPPHPPRRGAGEVARVHGTRPAARVGGAEEGRRRVPGAARRDGEGRAPGRGGRPPAHRRAGEPRRREGREVLRDEARPPGADHPAEAEARPRTEARRRGRHPRLLRRLPAPEPARARSPSSTASSPALVATAASPRATATPKPTPSRPTCGPRRQRTAANLAAMRLAAASAPTR
jgi:hypothetical protein